MQQQAKVAPRHRGDRLILHFDYDCFYAQVHENRNPALKSQPLGVRQKNILATCNYHARSRGVRKLMLASEAKQMCPELVLVDGEDLTPFRDTSKTLYQFLRSYSWNDKVERLGLDEVFMDVTDIVNYNMLCLNRGALASSFFHLSKKDPECGFACDLTSVAGCVEGDAESGRNAENAAHIRLVLGSHLAQFLRLKLDEKFGYTSSCGISTNKLLSKLAGTKNKPRSQTTLLAYTDEQVVLFVDPHTLRSIPGFGYKIARELESRIAQQEARGDSHSFESTLTAREVRLHPSVTPSFLETCLAGPSFERGTGSKLWKLLHGQDHSEVKQAKEAPSQISIEDTYKGIQTAAQIKQELHKLSRSLVRRMRIDLVVADEAASELGAQKWIATPKTLRLSVRSLPQAGHKPSLDYGRVSRSAPLPSFVFDLRAGINQLAERLVNEALLPLFRRFRSERDGGWNLQLINICVANMVVGAVQGKAAAGRDIAVMFKQQDEVLRPWKAIEAVDAGARSDHGTLEDSEFGDESSWDGGQSPTCGECGRPVPAFALPAHMRYHALEG